MPPTKMSPQKTQLLAPGQLHIVYSEHFQISFFSSLLVYMNCTKGFHCGTPAAQQLRDSIDKWDLNN
jgi:hypothetical protein